MGRLMSCSTALLLTILAAVPARAQLSVEGRAGLAFPTADFGANLSTGYSVGANAGFNVTPMIGVYGGYTFISFDPDEGFVGIGESTTYNVQGFDAGARVGLPMAGLSPYLRGGVVFYSGEFSDTNADAERTLGFQIGAGLDYVLGPTITFTPEVGYVQIAGEGNASDVSFIRTDLGLRFRF